MRYITIIIALFGALTISGCSNLTNTPQPLPTLVQLAAATTPPPTAAASATYTATRIPASPTLPQTSTPSLSATASASVPTRIVTRTPQPIASRTPTVFAASPTAPPSVSTPLPVAFSYGQSVEGRALEAFRFGDGPQIIMLIGGIHAGFEVNTVELIEAMVEHFQSTPQDVLPGISLILVPSLNPDGVTRGRQISGRFNANGVDLNRNWGCGWSADAEFHLGTVEPGPVAFSEPETTALGALIQQIRPAAVLFYHAAANGVYSGDCGGFNSDALAAIYGNASGYPYGESFGAYTVTGTGPSWVASQGIPSLDVELATATGTELARNLRGVMAVQNWLLGQVSD
jgi:hypothetical protein